MQVRTLIITLAPLQLLLSITSFIYKLANSQIASSHDQFSTPISGYLVSKYQICQGQIWAVQLGWQIVVIFSQAISGGFFIYYWRLRKAGGKFKISAQKLCFSYIIVSSGVIGQTIIAGYSIAIIKEIGFAGGTKLGDIAITVLQSLVLVVMLITISILTYNFQTLQQTPEKYVNKSETLNNQQTVPAVTQVVQPKHLDINDKKQNQYLHPSSHTINLFKPNLLQNTSPMGQHFQQVSQMIHPITSKRSIQQSLLAHQPPNQSAKDEQTIPISSKISRKKKVQVPRLNLQQMKKQSKQKRKESLEKKDPLFLLNNLQISAIQPLKQSKIGQIQDLNSSGDSQEPET